MKVPLRLGLVGLGKIARDQHLPAIAAAPGLELAAIASLQPGEGIAYRSLAEMLAGEPDLDAVILCQPPQARYAAARLALAAGKHVFLEKPPGATLSEVETLVDLARQRDLTLFAAWHSREAAAVEAARAMLADAAIRSVRIDWKEDVRIWHPGQQWIWAPGGFGVFDPGINALSILTAILPEPVRMVAAELETPANRAAPIAARLTMLSASEFPIEAEFDFRQTGPQSWNVTIETDRHRIVLAEGGSRLIVDGAERCRGEDREYPRLYARFAELVDARRSDVDLAPLRLVADAFLLGRNCPTDAFID
jgi:D-galactose 1-dehydrogenase